LSISFKTRLQFNFVKWINFKCPTIYFCCLWWDITPRIMPTFFTRFHFWLLGNFFYGLYPFWPIWHITVGRSNNTRRNLSGIISKITCQVKKKEFVGNLNCHPLLNKQIKFFRNMSIPVLIYMERKLNSNLSHFGLNPKNTIHL
jgi:hypothetical protein